MKFVKVATTDEMANQSAKCIEADGQKIALFKVEWPSKMGPQIGLPRTGERREE
jgi:hypothetical protein